MTRPDSDKLKVVDNGIGRQLKISKKSNEEILKKPFSQWTLPELRKFTGQHLLINMGDPYSKLYEFFKHELESEGPVHKKLVKEGLKYFKGLDYQVCKRKLSVVNVNAACDFIALSPDNELILGEALAPSTLKYRTVERKLQLTKFAALYFVVPMWAKLPPNLKHYINLIAIYNA